MEVHVQVWGCQNVNGLKWLCHNANKGMGSDVIEKESGKQNTEDHVVQKGTRTWTSELEILLRKAESWRADPFTLGVEVKLCSALHLCPSFSLPSFFWMLLLSLVSNQDGHRLFQVPPGPSSCAQKLSKEDTAVRSFPDSTVHFQCFWSPGSLVSMHSSEETGKGIHYNALFIVPIP